MILTLTQLREKRDEILALAEKHGATNVRVFGSIARGEQTSDSDVDFVVQYKTGTTLIDHIGFAQSLQELLGCPVDVTTDDTLHWYIRERVLNEAVSL